MQCHCHSSPRQKGNLLLPTTEQHDGKMQIISILIQKYLYIKAIQSNAVKPNRVERLKQRRQGRYDVCKTEVGGRRRDQVGKGSKLQRSGVKH